MEVRERAELGLLDAGAAVEDADDARGLLGAAVHAVVEDRDDGGGGGIVGAATLAEVDDHGRREDVEVGREGVPFGRLVEGALDRGLEGAGDDDAAALVVAVATGRAVGDAAAVGAEAVVRAIVGGLAGAEVGDAGVVHAELAGLAAGAPAGELAGASVAGDGRVGAARVRVRGVDAAAVDADLVPATVVAGRALSGLAAASAAVAGGQEQGEEGGRPARAE